MRKQKRLPLTPLEKKIVRYLILLFRRKEIKDYLHISMNTLDTHLKNIRRKWSAHNIPEVIDYALDHGFNRSGQFHGR